MWYVRRELIQIKYVNWFFKVGTGAVGSIYSWRLSQSCQVTTVCRSNYETVKKNGFIMESAKFGLDIFRPHNGNILLL